MNLGAKAAKSRLLMSILTGANTLSLLSGVIVFNAAPTYAEFVCESEVSVKWHKADEEKEVESKVGVVTGKGATEEKAKKSLAGALTKERSKALKNCKSEHENLSGCISSKYASLGPTVHQLDFAQKKSIRDAIATDCTARQGSCVSAEATEAACKDVTPPTAAPEEGKKDDKGKKK